jgi:hypothetical protein
MYRLGYACAATLAVAALLSGCGFYKKHQANKKNEQIVAAIGELQAQQANRYLPQEFNQLNQLLSQSQGALAAGNYDEALAAGNQALGSEEAPGLVDNLRARLPQARSIIEQKKAQLVDIQTRVAETMEQVIAIAPDETALIDSADQLNALVTQVQNSQAQVSEGDLGYDAALGQAKAFLDQATASLQVIEKRVAENLLIEINDAWTEATQLDVTKYVEESEQVPAMIDRASALIGSASYRAALDEFRVLPEELGRFRERARERRAAARIEQARRLIELAKEDPDASIDAIENAESAAREAGDALQEGNYDTAYNLAETAIETARNEVRGLEEDLQAQIDALAERIEQSLQWETERIAPDLYTEALGHLEQARENLTDILFEQSQDSIDRGAETIEDAISMARSKGLAQRVAEDEEALQATQEIGAFQYLREEYQAIQALLEDASRLISRYSFDEAEVVLDEVEERTQGLETGLRDLAQNRLAAAEADYQEALEAKAEDYAEEVLNQAASSLDDSRNAAASSNWKDAIASAEASQTQAQNAAQQSYRIQTDELQDSAHAEIDEAKAAGASSYAADLYNKSLSASNNSQVAYDEGHFRTALEELTQARDFASEARMRQIDQAQLAIDSAIAAKADEYQKVTLGEALADLSEARAKMEDDRYAESLELARAAETSAQTAESETWKTRATEALQELGEGVAQAEQDRAPTYAEAEFDAVSRTLHEAQSHANATEFKQAYEAADRGKGQLEEVFARLTDEARLVRGDYDRLIGDLKTFVQDDFGRERHMEATARLGRIDEAILRNNYRDIFNLYEEGEHEVQNQIVAVKLHNVNEKRKEISDRIARAQNAGLFQFVERGGEGIAADLAQIEYDPVLDHLDDSIDYYSEATGRLARLEDELNRLQESALANIDRRIEKIRTDIDNAGQIGAREMVPAVFNSAIDNFELARDMLYLMRTDIGGEKEPTFGALGQQLAAAEAQAAQLNRAAIVKNNSVNYLRDLIFWTFDMTRFLDQWYPIEEAGLQMIETSSPSNAADTYKVLQTGISARDLLREAERLYQRVQPLTPPDAQQEAHTQALRSFEMFVRVADSFYRYGQYNRYPKRVRQGFLATAYQDLERLHQLNERLILVLIQQSKAYDLTEFERELADEFNAFKSYLRRERTTR